MIEIKNIDGETLHKVEAETLQGANLQEANLRRVNLQGANLQGADLRRVNLQGADLQGANLQVADLWAADLRGANLQGADLWAANLQGTDLQGANLWGANLWGAEGLIFMGPIGRHKHIIYAVAHRETAMVRAGGFWGTMDEFESRLLEKYTEGEKGRAAYLAAVQLIREWYNEQEVVV